MNPTSATVPYQPATDGVAAAAGSPPSDVTLLMQNHIAHARRCENPGAGNEWKWRDDGSDLHTHPGVQIEIWQFRGDVLFEALDKRKQILTASPAR
jgi:hypothetical protein